MNKLFLTLFLLLFLNICFGQIFNVKAGLWSDQTAWSNNSIPTGSDSIVLNFNITIDINATCKSLNLNGHDATVNSGIYFAVLGIGTTTPINKFGAVNGKIKAYDRYGNESTKYSDITLKLFDKQSQVTDGSVNGDGTFRFDNILLGDITLAIMKPGYGFIDSVKYVHQKSFDTLTNIFVIEELPFAFKLNNVGYSNSFFNFSGSYSYHTDESYMVTEFICFSKNPEVSINHTNLLYSPSSSTNVQFITGTFGGSSGFSFQSFTDAGFKNGDLIYVTVIPNITKFWTSYYDENRNYKVIHYKVGNASNVRSFILTQ